MTWEFWFTIVIALIFMGVVIWAFVRIKKIDNPVGLSNYLFAYKIIKGDPKGLPTEFLVNWQISNLENHLYLLYLTLEEDFDIEEYLHKIWVGYSGNLSIYGKVYKIEGIIDTRNILIGTWEVLEGSIKYNKVGYN